MTKFEQTKNQLCGHLLIKSARLFFSHSTSAIIEKYDLGISESHFRVFPHLSPQGSTINEIAQKMGISKQAVSKLVNGLVDEGILYLEPCPDDGRSKRVRFKTNKGSSFAKSLNFLQTYEAKFRKILGGQDELDHFKQSLLKIQNHFDGEG